MSIGRALWQANELTAFALELVILAILAWWGWTRDVAGPVRVLLALGAPTVAAGIWAAFASPKAAFTLPIAGVLSVKALVFAAAVMALLALGHRNWAVVLAVVLVANVTIAIAGRP